MDHLIIDHRNVISLVLLISSFMLVPELVPALTQPFLFLWLRIKQYHRSVAVRSLRQPDKGFWEIDMTKFEP